MIDLTLNVPIRLAVVEVDGIRVTDEESGFEKLTACAGRYAVVYANQGKTAAGDVPRTQVARSLFRALGFDPTKTRPSSEALLRRALKRKPFYAINTLVDVGNWCSLDFLLPLGLFDRKNITDHVTLRVGHPEETYEGIDGKPVNLAGQYVLADGRGPFGSPVKDSRRTSITHKTSEAVMMILSPVDYDHARLTSEAKTAAARMVEVCGGHVLAIKIFDGGSGATRDIDI